MKRTTLAAALLAASVSAQSGEAYIGLDYAQASFKRAADSSESIAYVLTHEGFDIDMRTQTTDGGLSPVIGYQFSDTWGIEAGYRSFDFRTTIDATVGATTLYNVATGGASVPILGADFASQASTTIRGPMLGVTYTTRAGWYGKVSLTAFETCSRVYESSIAIGRTPEFVESRAGTCKETIGYALAVGYRQAIGAGWRLGVYAEAFPDTGNDGTVFVDGGGVGNATMATYGMQLLHTF